MKNQKLFGRIQKIGLLQKRRTTINKRYIVTPDKHFPLHNQKAINILKRSIEIVQPDGYIDLGDTGEWEGASHWKWKKKAKPALEWYLPEIITDVENVNKGMDQIDESLDKANVKEKHFIEGNHDNWMNFFVNEFPYLPQYKLATAIRLKERGYEYHPAGELYNIGKLNFYHGHLYAGKHHAANHLRQYGCNIMYGHHHDIQVATGTSKSGPIAAYSIGCLKSLEPKDNGFTMGRPINWINAFAIVDFDSQGNFYPNIIQIMYDKAFVFGEEIRG